MVGDIHGRFESLAEVLKEAGRRWVSFDFVLAVGDVDGDQRNSPESIIEILPTLGFGVLG